MNPFIYITNYLHCKHITFPMCNRRVYYISEPKRTSIYATVQGWVLSKSALIHKYGYKPRIVQLR